MQTETWRPITVKQVNEEGKPGAAAISARQPSLQLPQGTLEKAWFLVTNAGLVISLSCFLDLAFLQRVVKLCIITFAQLILAGEPLRRPNPVCVKEGVAPPAPQHFNSFLNSEAELRAHPQGPEMHTPLCEPGHSPMANKKKNSL